MEKRVLNAVKTVNWKRWTRLALFAGLLLLPALAFADAGSANFGEAEKKICGVMGSIHGILKVVSIVVVTVAIIFAGYQIAFAHKRIADVAPILIGGLLIGAAGQLAAMIIGKNENGFGDCEAQTAYILVIDTNNRNA